MRRRLAGDDENSATDDALNQIDDGSSKGEARAEEVLRSHIASSFIDGAIAVNASWVQQQPEAYHDQIAALFAFDRSLTGAQFAEKAKDAAKRILEEALKAPRIRQASVR